MLSKTRLSVKKVREARPRTGEPATFHVFDPAQGVGARPVGTLTHLDGPDGEWRVWLGSGLGTLRFVGAFPDSPCGCPTGKAEALRAIARAL